MVNVPNVANENITSDGYAPRSYLPSSRFLQE